MVDCCVDKEVNMFGCCIGEETTMGGRFCRRWGNSGP